MTPTEFADWQRRTGADKVTLETLTKRKKKIGMKIFCCQKMRVSRYNMMSGDRSKKCSARVPRSKI
jgi:hypothetical protein